MSTPAEWMDAALARLVAHHSLQPVGLPSDQTHAQGRHRGAPARLEARAFQGAAVRLARAVSVFGEGLEIHNLLVLSPADRAAPLLGVDVVDLGKPELIVVADASPPPGTVAPTAVPAPPLAGPLPSWCGRFFSPTPLFLRVPREAFASAVAALDARLEQVLAPAPAHPFPAEHARWQQAYLDAHRTEDRGLLMLGKLFGERWAQLFLEQVLFPVRWAGE